MDEIVYEYYSSFERIQKRLFVKKGYVSITKPDTKNKLTLSRVKEEILELESFSVNSKKYIDRLSLKKESLNNEKKKLKNNDDYDQFKGCDKNSIRDYTINRSNDLDNI